MTRRKATEALIHKGKQLPRPASGDAIIIGFSIKKSTFCNQKLKTNFFNILKFI